MLPFNSLSRDHVLKRKGIPSNENSRFQLPLSGSPGAFAYAKYGWESTFNFQLPLSGSPPGSGKTAILEAIFQLPLSGSRESSDPGGRERKKESFNSLSRDHDIVERRF